MYETLDKPPRPGSILEVLCVMLQMRREVARFQETRALVQALRDGDEGESTRKAFNDYRYALMPFLSDQDKEEEKKLVEALNAEVARGGLKVQALSQPTPVLSQLRDQSQIRTPHDKVAWKRNRRW